jgi:hypothetical protein
MNGFFFDENLPAKILFPNAQIFGIRIGHRGVHRFGFRSPSVSP